MFIPLEICEILKNICFEECLRSTASTSTNLKASHYPLGTRLLSRFSTKTNKKQIIITPLRIVWRSLKRYQEHLWQMTRLCQKNILLHYDWRSSMTELKQCALVRRIVSLQNNKTVIYILTLRENCPNTEFCLVCIFQYSD